MTSRPHDLRASVQPAAVYPAIAHARCRATAISRCAWSMACSMAVIIVTALGSGGCIPSRPTPPEAKVGLAYLNDNPWDRAQRPQEKANGRSIPTVWTIKWAPQQAQSLGQCVKAQLDSGAGEVVVPLGSDQARRLADHLDQAQALLLRIKSLQQPVSVSQRARWSQTTASVLVEMEGILRQAQQSGQAISHLQDQPSLVRAVAGLMNEAIRQELLGPLEEGEQSQLRTVLAGLVLRVSFALARHQVPDNLTQEVSDRLGQTPRPEDLEKDLTRQLTEALARARPAAHSDQLRRVVERALTFGPVGLRTAQSLLRQWDRFESIRFEYRRYNDQPIVEVAFNLLPGHRVRLASHALGPVLELRGPARMVIQPAGADDPQVLVHMEGLDDQAGAWLVYPGALWAMVRWLVLPLEDMELREFRLASAWSGDERAINVQVVGLAAGGGDRRRLIAFQGVQLHRLDRKPFYLSYPTVLSTNQFSYVRPDRMYTVSRVSTPTSQPAPQDDGAASTAASRRPGAPGPRSPRRSPAPATSR